jgi:hypothetical protein
LDKYEGKPQMHLYYGDRLESMEDSLPKYKHFPKEFGGSGELL